MGGNVFKNEYQVQRLDRNNFLKVESIIIDRLKAINVAAHKIPFIRNKESFGDLDLIISLKDKDKVIDWISRDLLYPYSSNGNVTSLYYYPFKFQIDFLFIPEEQLEYAKHYFAWGCAGNLIGRLAKKLGFKHGHKGLYLVQRDGDYVIDEIILSNNYLKIIQILELDVDKYLKGFDSEEELFEWFSKSPYFNLEFFKFENLPNKDRVRDRKRKDYSSFITWCENHSFKPSKFCTENKLSFVLQFFPEISDEVKKNFEYISKKKQIKEKFNGQLVMELTGLKDKALGNFIFYFRSKYNDDFILNSSLYWIKIFIIAEYSNTKENLVGIK